MVVQHNLQAMNSSRMLNITTNAQSKNTEKLSSGYKINRASDDAAGLSISEKMRKQIRGLDRASTNASDGVSCVQTAEGALNEVHDMLQRMNELCVQAANGTNSLSDRQAIQNEIEQLSIEIDRIAETTKFNETLLLKGDNGMRNEYINAHDAGLEGTLIQNTTEGTFTMKALEPGDKYTIGGIQYEIGAVNNTEVANALNLDGNQYNLGTEVWWKDADGNKYTMNYKLGVGDRIQWGPMTSSLIIVADDTADVDTTTQIKISDVTSVVGEGTDIKMMATDDNLKAAVEASAKRAGLTLNNSELTAAAGTVKATVVTDNTTDPVTTSDVQLDGNTAFTAKGVFNLAIGDTIMIDDKSYTISANDDVANAQITSDKILDLITTGSTVKYNGNSVTRFSGKLDTGYTTGIDTDNVRIADNGTIVDKSKPILINANQAYELVKIELKAASTIGALTKGATVIPEWKEVDVLSSTGVASKSIEFKINKGYAEVQNDLTFNLHVGADADMGNKINVNIQAMSARNLGIAGINVADTTGKGATYAIDAIGDALLKVSDQRAELGAAQNRLEHSINNLDNVVENTTAAESRIRDTDMADAMVEYSKNNILQQAGQSMLAQANQATQGVMNLLQ